MERCFDEGVNGGDRDCSDGARAVVTRRVGNRLLGRGDIVASRAKGYSVEFDVMSKYNWSFKLG